MQYPALNRISYSIYLSTPQVQLDPLPTPRRRPVDLIVSILCHSCASLCILLFYSRFVDPFLHFLKDLAHAMDHLWETCHSNRLVIAFLSVPQPTGMEAYLLPKAWVTLCWTSRFSPLDVGFGLCLTSLNFENYIIIELILKPILRENEFWNIICKLKLNLNI